LYYCEYISKRNNTENDENKQENDLPEGWIKKITTDGREFYHNFITKTSQWKKPEEEEKKKKEEKRKEEETKKKEEEKKKKEEKQNNEE
jgi:hypothetical protein